MGSQKKKEAVRVTIGMCVKNSEKTVKSALESVLNQNIPRHEMELIIVDGYSNDSSVKFLKERLKKTDIKFRFFFENSGLGMARQMVVDRAIGDYVIWVDADMILPQSYVLKQVSFMDDHPKVGIAAGKYALYIGQGTVADLENIVYAVDSVYGEKGASKFGHLPGTEGSIFRLNAIRQIGGFDTRINGASEDIEVAYRMRRKGWELAITNEKFAESTRQSWLSLWTQYVWYGRGSHFVFHKDSGGISLWKMMPMAGFLAGVLRTPKAYLLIHKKTVFLLPFHYTYKRTAWLFGFISAHVDGYGHFAN
jgi:glycosyltransferase involved in cell wall biosynthesis